MGVVYRARHADLGREVALKVILPDQYGDGPSAEQRKRFEREARAAAALAAHPNIVGVHDAGAHGDELYLAMELVPGQALDDLIDPDGGGDRSFEELARWVMQSARAVQHAHDQGILHRDIKPANILIDEGGTARVTDFGLARHTAADADTMKLTRSDAILGTPAYMSPEQALGDPLDGRTDIYALGATLHAALTGKPPHGNGSLLELLTSVIQSDPVPPRTRNPAVPVDLDTVVMCCLEKQPDRRYRSAGALADDLQRFLDGDRVLATRPGLLRRGVRWAQSHRLATSVGVVAIAAAATLGAGTWWVSSKSAGDVLATGEIQDQGEAVEQGRLASQLFQALSLASLPHLRRLEDHRHGAALDSAAVGQVLQALDRDVASAAVALGAPAGAPQVQAWQAFGRFLARDDRFSADVTPLRALVQPPGGDPFPAMLLARALLSYYATTVKHPSLQVTDRGVEVTPFAEGEAQATAREEAATLVQAARASAMWRDLTAGQAYARLADAVKEMQSRQWADAAAILRELMTDQGLQGTAGRLAGIAFTAAGEHAEAALTFEDLAERGWPEPWAHAAGANMNSGVLAQLAGEDPAPYWDRADHCIAQALALAPNAPRYFASRGVLAMERGRAATGDPDRQIAMFEHAVRDFTTAISGGWGGDTTWLNRANSRARLGECFLLSGKDGADAMLGLAIADATQALELRPGLSTALSVRALAWVRRAEAWRNTGKNTAQAFRNSLADLTRIIQGLKEPQARHFVNRGQVYVSVAGAVGEATKAGVEALKRSRADLRRAVAMEPEDGVAWRALGMTLRTLAIADMRQRLDASGWIDEALAAFHEALRNGRDDWETHMRLGGMHTVQARWLASQAVDPKDALRRGRAAISVAISQAPNAAEPYAERGLAWLAEATWLLNSQGDPLPAFEAGLADYDEAIARNPGRMMSFLRRAALLEQWAKWTERARRDPWELYLKAALDYDHALKLAPASLSAAQRATFARVPLVRMAVQRQQSPHPHAVIGLAAANLAARYHKQLPPNLSLVRIQFAIALKRWDEAEAAVDYALTLAPNERKWHELKREIEAQRGR